MLSSGISTNLCTTSILTSTESSKLGSGSNQMSSLVQCSCTVPHAARCPQTQLICAKFEKGFFGSGTAVLKQGVHFHNCKHNRAVVPEAVMTAPAENSQEHVLDGGLRLKVMIGGSPLKLEFQLSNCHLNSPVLHWGLTQPGSRKWRLPSDRPEGTRDFQNQALQTPFRKSGDLAFLTIEMKDTKFDAIEFILKDDSSNQWLKFQGGNFRIPFPKADTNVTNISVPEELVQIQSYLRWERAGKQNYSAEQQREEYENARKELQEEVARGVSIDALRAKLLGKEDDSSKSSRTSDASSFEVEIPDDLVQVQSYVRWERAGKPNFSVEEQTKEFAEARKDLQREIANGVTIKDLYKRFKIDPSDAKASKSSAKRRSSIPRIQRKKRDYADLISTFQPTEENDSKSSSSTSSKPTALELAAEEVVEGEILNKKLFTIGENHLLALVSLREDNFHILLASDYRQPLALHWGVSKSSKGEWRVPPTNILPANSTPLEGSCETPFNNGFASNEYFQSLEIVIRSGEFIGMPFVMHSGESWIKNNGSDFYLSLDSKKSKKDIGTGEGTAKWLLDEICNSESDAERSLMHRFNIAANLTQNAKGAGQLPLVAILVWMRFMATRQLTWNKNYNVKPREISAAQDRLTALLRDIYRDQPGDREIVRIILYTVGRGGTGDVGQRIRDEILVVQRKNDCKGGMMEEWHQKLHNNTSPDDVVICQALLEYCKSNMDINVYWDTLKANGVTKERLKSYDRPIVSEPNLRVNQKEGLIRDLSAYMKTLKAVHSGADLESAVATCMGYSAEGEDFMGSVKIHPISGLSSDLPFLLGFVLDHVEDKNVIPLIEGLVEARRELHPSLLKDHDRLRDIIFLDLALDSTLRTAVERGMEGLSNAKPEDIIYMIIMVLENLALSSSNNEELVYCLKEWSSVHEACKSGQSQWPLRAKAVSDRTRLILADKAEEYQKLIQPSAEYLGNLLGVEKWAIDIFTEEIIRSGSAASLSQLLNRIDPVLRAAANLGSWQVISPVEVRGYVEVVGDLGTVQDKVYERPTILIANKVKGEEEIPDGVVAVLTPDMPDVLSHVSVRARNGKICFATCFDMKIFGALQQKKGAILKLQPKASDLTYSEVTELDTRDANAKATEEQVPGISLNKKEFGGKYAVTAAEFNNDLVGAKSRNVAHLKNKLPSWIKVPTSVALPFGSFENVLSEDINHDVATQIRELEASLGQGDFSKLPEIRKTVLGLQAPESLVEELRKVMKGSNMPWPGDGGQQRWEQAWTAIKRVWASKWNERAYFSTRKAKIDHRDLCMAVLVQEIVQADYAFVIHTTNPSNEDSSEIYAEVVKGLGETLVGAYAGRALSFIAKKNNLKSPHVTGYPSKRVGLFIKRSIIFRSDSNGEDLEGYAGAGLYDSVPMDEEEERCVDYSSDPLVVDVGFQQSILSKIAEAGEAVEKLFGSPQDIEGVIKDGELYLVQTRPQM